MCGVCESGGGGVVDMAGGGFVFPFLVGPAIEEVAQVDYVGNYFIMMHAIMHDMKFCLFEVMSANVMLCITEKSQKNHKSCSIFIMWLISQC